MDEALDAALFAEREYMAQGQRMGQQAAAQQAAQNGRALGLQRGAEIGCEVGYYSGCIDTWESLLASDPAFTNESVQRAVRKIRDLSAQLALISPDSERLTETLSQIRSAFKLICARLKRQQPFEVGTSEATSF